MDWKDAHYFQTCRNWHAPAIDGEISVDQLLARIKTKTPPIERVRAAVAAGDDQARIEAKGRVPMICPSARFSGKKANEHIYELLPFAGFDVDLGDNQELDVALAKQQIGQLPEIRACWTSSSGRGINGIYARAGVAGRLGEKYQTTEEMEQAHRQNHQAFSAHIFEKTGLHTDPAMGSPSQGLLISHDPNPLVNEAPIPFVATMAVGGEHLMTPSPAVQALSAQSVSTLQREADHGAEVLLARKEADLLDAVTAEHGRHRALMRLGFTAGQLAGRVPDERIQDLEEAAGALEGVTSNARQSFKDAFQAGTAKPLERQAGHHPPASPESTPTANGVVFPPTKPLCRPSKATPWPVPEAALPRVLRDYAMFLMQSLSIPLIYVINPMIAFAAALLGGKFRVGAGEKWYVPLTFWALNVGRPGSNKGGAARAAHEPIRRLEARWNEEYLQEKQEHKRQTVEFELLRKELETDYRKARKDRDPVARDLTEQLAEEPKAPVQRVLTVSDITVEKAEMLLAARPSGFLIYSDEFSSLKAQMSKAGRENLKSLLLVAWEGSGSVHTQRVSREGVYVNQPLISIFCTTQPDKIDHELNREDFDGFMARFQGAAYPILEPYVPWYGRIPQEVEDRYIAGLLRLEELDPELVGASCNEQGQYLLQLTEDAMDLQRAWVGFVKSAERLPELNSYPFIAAVVSKAASLPAKLAGILHMLQGRTGRIAADVLADAIALALMYFTHSERMFLEHDERHVDPPEVLIADLILDERLSSPFTARHLKQRNLRGLKPAAVDRGLSALVDAGWLVAERLGTGGRPSCQYHVNPRIFKVSPYAGFEGGFLNTVLNPTFNEWMLPQRGHFVRFQGHEPLRQLFHLTGPVATSAVDVEGQVSASHEGVPSQAEQQDPEEER